MGSGRSQLCGSTGSCCLCQVIILRDASWRPDIIYLPALKSAMRIVCHCGWAELRDFLPVGGEFCYDFGILSWLPNNTSTELDHMQKPEHL